MAGEANYVRAGFLANVYEPWAHFEGTEWGEYMEPLWRAADAAVSVSMYEEGLILIGMFANELTRAYEDGWVAEAYPAEVRLCQERYAEVEAYWRDRAANFEGEDALSEEIGRLPEWVRGFV